MNFHVRMEKTGFLLHVSRKLPEMYPAERRIGEFILEFPGNLATYSATELAQFVGVSNATVSRFFKRLGYSNYNEARREVREESRAGSRLLLQRTEGQGADWLSISTAQSLRNVEQTLTEIGSDQIDEIAARMLEARRIWTVGFRTNHPLARYLQWQSRQIVAHIETIPGAGETMGESLVDVGSDDLVIVFGLRRRIPLVFRTLDAIERIGVAVLYITDERARLRPSATWHLRCHTQTADPLFDHVSVMALCHKIVSRAIERSGTSGRTRLRRIEKLHNDLGEL